MIKINYKHEYNLVAALAVLNKLNKVSNPLHHTENKYHLLDLQLKLVNLNSTLKD
jgi:hypothetical protein